MGRELWLVRHYSWCWLLPRLLAAPNSCRLTGPTLGLSLQVSDTYANQGARAGAILPFTSALSGLCAATTVAVVEALPRMEQRPLQEIDE